MVGPFAGQGGAALTAAKDFAEGCDTVPVTAAIRVRLAAEQRAVLREGGQAAETVQRDESIGQRRRALAAAPNTAVEELEQERTLRVRRAALRPERVALFIAIARRGGPATAARARAGGVGAPIGTARGGPAAGEH